MLPSGPAAEEEEPFPGNGTTPRLRCLSLPSKPLPSSYFPMPSRSIICLFFVFLCVNLYELSVAQAVLGCPGYLHLHLGNPNLCISRKKQNLHSGSPHPTWTKPCGASGKSEIAERGVACSDHAVIIYHSLRYCISLKKNKIKKKDETPTLNCMSSSVKR